MILMKVNVVELILREKYWGRFWYWLAIKWLQKSDSTLANSREEEIADDNTQVQDIELQETKKVEMFKTIMKFREVPRFLSPVRKKLSLLKTVTLHPFQLKGLAMSGPMLVGEFGMQQVCTWRWSSMSTRGEGGCMLLQEEPSNKTTQMMDGYGKE